MTLPIPYLESINQQIDTLSTKHKNLPVDVVHRESLDVVFAQNLLLATVDVSQTDVNEHICALALVVLDPTKAVFLVLLGQTSQERHGHTVHVSAVRCLGRVDVGVSIDQDDGELSASSFSDSLGSA